MSTPEQEYDIRQNTFQNRMIADTFFHLRNLLINILICLPQSTLINSQRYLNDYMEEVKRITAYTVDRLEPKAANTKLLSFLLKGYAHAIRNQVGKISSAIQIIIEFCGCDVSQTHINDLIQLSSTQTDKNESLVPIITNSLKQAEALCNTWQELGQFLLHNQVSLITITQFAREVQTLTSLIIKIDETAQKCKLPATPLLIIINELVNNSRQIACERRASSTVEVQVSIGSTQYGDEQDHTSLIISIKDWAGGFQDTSLQPGETNRAGGTGTGFIVVQQILDSLEGTVEKNNWTEEGKRGAVVTITLPVTMYD